MKKKRTTLLMLLLTSFLLCACDEGGFTAAKHSGSNNNESTSDEGKKDDNTNQYAGHGSSGSEEEPHENDNENTDQPNQVSEQDGEGEGTKVDLGIQITTFKSVCWKTSDDYYINVSFDSNPFEDKYQFAYYTVNDIQLKEENFQEKEIINEKETYKIYVGSNTSGVYVIKFYNSNQIQYGRSDISVKFRDANLGKTYISVAFNIIQIRITSFFYMIKERFERFTNSFNSDSISLNK